MNYKQAELREALFKILSWDLKEAENDYNAYIFEAIDDMILPAMQRFMPDVEELELKMVSHRTMTYAAKAIAKRLEVK